MHSLRLKQDDRTSNFTLNLDVPAHRLRLIGGDDALDERLLVVDGEVDHPTLVIQFETQHPLGVLPRRTGNRATGSVPDGRPGAPYGSLCAPYRGPAQSIQAVRAPYAPNQPQHETDSAHRQDNTLPERSLLLTAILPVSTFPPPIRPGPGGAAGAELRQGRGRFLWQSSKRFLTMSSVPVLGGRGRRSDDWRATGLTECPAGDGGEVIL